MKITILTPSYNQGAYIERTIQSVMNQNWNDIEHIVIDGGSTDNTIEILKTYNHIRWISEPDHGQADALNKGLAMATGDIIGWINSDDYYRENIFLEVVTFFNDLNTQWIIGNITVCNDLQLEIETKSSEITYEKLISNPDIVKQQAAFFRISVLKMINGWDKSYHMIMDYDLWVRLSKIALPKMVNRYWAVFTLHSGQKTSYANLLRQIREIERVLSGEQIKFLPRKFILKKKYYYYLKSMVKNILIRLKFINPIYTNISRKIRQ